MPREVQVLAVIPVDQEMKCKYFEFQRMPGKQVIKKICKESFDKEIAPRIFQ